MSLDALMQRAGAKARHGKPAAHTAPVAPTSTTPPVVIPPYQPFPVEALPPILREFVEEVASSVDCDAAYAALPALTAAGAAAGAAVVVSPKRRFREPPAIWSATVGDSGTGKSPGMAPVADMVFGIGKKLKANFKEKWKRYEQDMEQWNEDKESKDKPEKPTREYFAVVDLTIERLAEMIGDSPRGLLLVRDELAGWFGSFTRYKSKGGTDIPNWLSMFDAGPIQINRRTGEPRDIETDRGFVAVLGGVQPEILRSALSDPNYVTSGLAARILFAVPPKACPRWSEAELSQCTEDAFANILNKLRGIPYSPRTGPEVVLLEPAALARFKSLNNEFAEQAEGLDGGPMAAVMPKAVRYSLRLALIDHLVRRSPTEPEPHGGPLTLESMDAGETLARWFVGEAERVYAMIAETSEDRAARSLTETIRRKGGRISPRDLQRTNAAKFRTSALAELALDGLVSAGVGEWVEGSSGPQGGRPTRLFVLQATRHTTKAARQHSARKDDEDDRLEREAINQFGGG